MGVKKTPEVRFHAWSILGLTDSKIQGDHLNHKTLDNRVTEIKPVTNRQNSRNRKAVG